MTAEKAARPTRRRFAAALAALPAAAAALPWIVGDDRLAALRALGRLAVRRGAASAGDPGLEAVARLLAAPGPAAERLRRAVAADFAAGEVVRLDGWVLSRTEVRLGVLAWLGASPGPRPAAG